MKLEKTIEMMTSEDYKERFKAEYYQLRERKNSLQTMLRKWTKGELDFEPTCPYYLLMWQLEEMKEYEKILKIRADIEGIEL